MQLKLFFKQFSYFWMIYLIAYLIFSCNVKEKPAKEISLDKWLFIVGDKPIWNVIGSKNNDWLPYSLENKHRNDIFFNYNGFSWFKTSFYLDASILDNTYSSDSLKLALGPVGGADQIFINGRLIGENGFSKDKVSSDSIFERIDGSKYSDWTYKIQLKDSRLLWNHWNTVIVRAYNKGERGGLLSKKITVGSIGLEDLIFFDKRHFYKVNSTDFKAGELIERFFYVKNISANHEVEGKLLFVAKDVETGKELFKKYFWMTLRPNEQHKIDIDLPINTNSTATEIKLLDLKTGFSISQRDTINYILEKQP